MHTAINIALFIIAAGCFWMGVKELAQSQKNSEKYTAAPDMLQLSIDLKNIDGVGVQRVTHCAETLEELQVFLNSFALFRVHRACVWTNTKMTHVIDARGVLEAV